MIAVFILVGGVGTAAGEGVFSLEFTLSQTGEVSNVTADIVADTVFVPGDGSGPYRFEAIDEEGNVIYRQDADFSFTTVSYGGGVAQRDTVTTLVKLPYVPEATAIQFSHDGNVLTTFDLPTYLCETAPDNTCHAYCDGKGVDPDCGDTSGWGMIVWVVIVAALLLVGVVIYLSVLPER